MGHWSWCKDLFILSYCVIYLADPLACIRLQFLLTQLVTPPSTYLLSWFSESLVPFHDTMIHFDMVSTVVKLKFYSFYSAYHLVGCYWYCYYFNCVRNWYWYSEVVRSLLRFWYVTDGDCTSHGQDILYFEPFCTILGILFTVLDLIELAHGRLWKAWFFSAYRIRKICSRWKWSRTWWT